MILSTVSYLGMVSFATSTHTHNFINHVCECGAKELKVYSEVIEFNKETTAATDHFTLTADILGDGWWGNYVNTIKKKSQ